MRADMASRRTSGLWWIAGAAVLWSTGGLFIKLAPMSGPAVVVVRSVISALLFLGLCGVRLGEARLSSALAYAGTVSTFVLATKLTSAANAVFLQYTGPAYVLVLGPLLLGERFRPRDAACLVISLAGMSLCFVGRLGGGHLTGDLLAAASGVFHALTVVCFRRDAVAKPGGALASTTLGSLIAAAIFLPFCATELGGLRTPGALAISLYLGLVQMGLAYVLFARGIATTSAASASMVATLEPVLSPVWVMLGTAERPTGPALLGGAIVVGVVIVRTLLEARQPVSVSAAPAAPVPASIADAA
jgi:drug/metabolite transporter (DMT)-like permease